MRDRLPVKKILALALAFIFLTACLAPVGFADGESAPPTPSATLASSPAPAPTPTPRPARTISCLFIGDSTTERGAVTRDILEYQGTGWLKVRLLGSRGASPNLHEGRAGWTARNYVSSSSAGGMKNSFYNKKTKQFDFSYYMKQRHYKGVNYVFINLGINDVFPYKTDKALFAEINRVLKRYDQMVASIHKFNRNIKIGICVTIPPTNSASGFKAIYGRKQTLARYQRNNRLLAQALTKRFGKQESKKVFLVDIRNHINRGLIAGVHPSKTGYAQIAKYIWSWLIKQES